MPACTWPDRIAVVAGAVPLNGMFWIESPARALSSSPARWPLAAAAGNAEVELAGPLPGVADEFGERVDRQRRVDGERGRDDRHRGDRGEVGRRIVAQLAQVHVDGGGAGRAQHHSVAVGGAFGDLGDADLAGRTRLVLDHHRLAEALGEMRTDGARDQVDAAARRERHHDADRPARKTLRQRRRGKRQRDGDDAG
jgi:hypothetical protein